MSISHQLRSRAKRAPFATSVQGRVLIKGVDIDQTLVIAEHELKRGRFASVLTLWGIRDQVYTEAQAQRVSDLYFRCIDARKDYFDVWHFTWAISNIYRTETQRSGPSSSWLTRTRRSEPRPRAGGPTASRTGTF